MYLPFHIQLLARPASHLPSSSQWQNHQCKREREAVQSYHPLHTSAWWYVVDHRTGSLMHARQTSARYDLIAGIIELRYSSLSVLLTPYGQGGPGIGERRLRLRDCPPCLWVLSRSATYCTSLPGDHKTLGSGAGYVCTFHRPMYATLWVPWVVSSPLSSTDCLTTHGRCCRTFQCFRNESFYR